MAYQTQISKLLSIVFPITGASMLLASVIDAFKNYQFIKKGLRIEGKVITISTGKQPVIEFLPTGKTKLIEFSSSGAVDYKVGEGVTILYLKDSNPYFMVDTPGSLLFGPVLLAAIGMVQLKVGLELRRIVRCSDLQ